MLRKVITFFMVFVASLFFVGNTHTSPTENTTFETPNTLLKGPELPATIYPPIFPREKITDQVQCLAKNIYFEAATQSTAGKLAVAFVTKNRVDSQIFPNTFCEVIYEGIHYSSGMPKRDRCQFSWYCDGIEDVPYNGIAWKKSQLIALWFYRNKKIIIDITDGATHYHADWMIKYPKWAKQYKQTVKIDQHIFYQNVKNKNINNKTSEISLAVL